MLDRSTHDVHASIAPNPRFLCVSGTGRRGDTIQQFDWCVGAVLDSFDPLPALLDLSKAVRDHVVTQSGVASQPACARAIRVGKWKLLTQQDNPSFNSELYDLEKDLAETTKIAAQQPDIVARLTEMLAQSTRDGRIRLAVTTTVDQVSSLSP